MGIFEIEKNVPIGKETRGRKSKYRFHLMEIGDSIFVSIEDNPNNAVTAAVHIGKRYNMKFHSEQSSKDGRKGKRIWRIA